MLRQWVLPQEDASQAAEANALAAEFTIPLSVARVMVARGIGVAEAADFLSPRLKTLNHPESLAGVAEATALIAQTMENNQRIVLYGDYDVDGVSSLALLARLLQGLGANVSCFLPHRMEEGYGLTVAGVERCCNEHEFELLIACDCGTNSRDVVAALRTCGRNVIILDHHEPEAGRVAEPNVLVNPKLTPDSPLRNLCSAGVVFKVAHALLKYLKKMDVVDLREYLDFVALATLADIVPLMGENRIFVHHGLRRLAASRWVGLRALATVCRVGASVRSSDVSFRIGPRINAAGRLATASAALNLLLTDDIRQATEIAAQLDVQNRERQAVEQKVLVQVEAWVEKNFEPSRDLSIVIGGEGWHAGVLGIVASRLMKQYHRPAIVVEFGEDGMCHGSCRSIPGFSIIEALGLCSSLLDKYGGHDMAAGVSLRRENFEAFRHAMESIAHSVTDRRIYTPLLHIDAEVELEDITSNLVFAKDRLEPFGNGNPDPLFCVRGVTPLAAPRVLKGKHLSFVIGHPRRTVRAVFFNGTQHELPRTPWDVAFHLDLDTYAERNEPQLRVVSIRTSQDD